MLKASALCWQRSLRLRAMSTDGSSCIWRPSLREKKNLPSRLPSALGTQISSSLSHPPSVEFTIWLSYIWEIQTMLAFVVYSLCLFLCTHDDVNQNNTVTDLDLTHLAIFFACGVHSEAADWYFNHLSHVTHVASFHMLVDFHLNWCWVPYGRPLWVDFLHLVSVFPECYTANGEDYRGFQNQTSLHGGKPCLFWNETFQHPYNTLKYPNGEGGLGSHNYCRWVRHCCGNTPLESLCCPKDKLTRYLKCSSQHFWSPAFISIKLMPSLIV